MYHLYLINNVLSAGKTDERLGKPAPDFDLPALMGKELSFLI